MQERRLDPNNADESLRPTPFGEPTEQRASVVPGTAGSLLGVMPDYLLKVSRGGACLSLGLPERGVSATEPGSSQQIDRDDAMPEQLAKQLVSLVDLSLRTSKPRLFERQVTIDRSPCHYEIFMVPIGDDEVVTLVYDVTRRRRQEEQMLRLQRIESLAHFAFGAIHDFNNLLTAIMGYCQLATRAQGRVDTLLTSLLEIQKVAERGAELCRQMLLFSGRQTAEAQIVSPNDLVQGTGTMLRRLIGEDIQLIMGLHSDVGLVRIDPGQFEQVLVNLVSNARDAMPDGGKLTTETANVKVDTDSDAPRIPGGAEHGERVMLVVSDTGTGMPPEVAELVFEPFFTTKGPGKGTGLGMFISYGIVTQNGGNIIVHSEPDSGTRFEVYLPRVPVDSGAGSGNGGPGPAPRCKETVLVVEDDQVVRDVAATILRQEGYTVLEAGDGVEALAVVESDTDTRVDLLLTDVVMPSMNGREVAERLRSLLPDLKILYTSGYAVGAFGQTGDRQVDSSFIEKPFTPVQLAQKVQALLED